MKKTTQKILSIWYLSERQSALMIWTALLALPCIPLNGWPSPVVFTAQMGFFSVGLTGNYMPLPPAIPHFSFFCNFPTCFLKGFQAKKSPIPLKFLKKKVSIMKVKTTRKAIVASTFSDDLLSVGYCGIQTLLRNHSPIAYTCGVYGWNFDVYQVYGKTICTGYRNMPGRKPNNIAEYEVKARKILDDAINSPAPRDWNKVDSAIEALLEEFCEQA